MDELGAYGKHVDRLRKIHAIHTFDTYLRTYLEKPVLLSTSFYITWNATIQCLREENDIKDVGDRKIVETLFNELTLNLEDEPVNYNIEKRVKAYGHFLLCDWDKLHTENRVDFVAAILSTVSKND